MWTCLECKKQFVWPRPQEVGTVSCPHCGSHEIREVYEPRDSCGPCHVIPSLLPELSGRRRPVISDSLVINSLERYGSEWPEIFHLVWGIDPAVLNVFSEEHRKIVADILLEKTREEESDDPVEKKLHHIIAELLYVEYRKSVNDYVEAATKRMNAARGR